MIEGVHFHNQEDDEDEDDKAAKESTDDNQVVNRSYWRCTNQDFFPQESFSSWKANGNALTRSRLIDRFLSRSEDDYELRELRKQCLNEMKRCLNWWDLMWFGFGSIIGSRIFVLTGQEAHDHARPAIVLSYVASELFVVLSVFCYTEFAVEIPVDDKSFAYLRVELGDFAAFIAAGNILLESIVGTAAVARASLRLSSDTYQSPGPNNGPFAFLQKE